MPYDFSWSLEGDSQKSYGSPDKFTMTLEADKLAFDLMDPKFYFKYRRS